MSSESKTGGRNVLVIITADNCGHCVQFKPQIPEITTQLAALGILVIHYPLVKMFMPLSTTGLAYPADIASWNPWYPTIALFTAKSWDNAMANPTDASRKLDGTVFGGTKSGSGKWGELLTGFRMNADGITGWVKSLISTPQYRIGGTTKMVSYSPSSSSSSSSSETVRVLPTTGSKCPILNIVNKSR